MIYCNNEGVDSLLDFTLPPLIAYNLSPIIHLARSDIHGSAMPVLLPRIQDYPKPYPKDERGFMLANESFKASLARTSLEDRISMEELGYISREFVKGVEMISVNFETIGLTVSKA